LLVKWYSANYRLDRTGRNYLKTVIKNLLEIASIRHSASLHGSQIQMANIDAKRIVCTLTIEYAANNRLKYEKGPLNSRKNSRLHKTNQGLVKFGI
jgi:hypothetical protein